MLKPTVAAVLLSFSSLDKVEVGKYLSMRSLYSWLLLRNTTRSDAADAAAGLVAVKWDCSMLLYSVDLGRWAAISDTMAFIL